MFRPERPDTAGSELLAGLFSEPGQGRKDLVGRAHHGNASTTGVGNLAGGEQVVAANN